MNYEQAKATLKTARSVENGKPLCNNTRLFQRKGAIAVQLHQTDVVTFYPNGRVMLDSGGWRSMTTSARMNEYGPIGVYSHRGVWYVNTTNGSTWGDHKRDPVFKDRMIIHPLGKVTGAARRTEIKRVAAYRRKAKAYSAEFIRLLFDRKIPAPSSGDCFGCRMKTDDGKRPFGGPDHMKGHIREPYYVPSLLFVAMETMGASDIANHLAYTLTHDKPAKGWDEGGMGDNMRKDMARMLYRFVLKESGLSY